MANFIKITVKGKDYLLGYPNRRSVARCEEITGLKLMKIEDNLISSGDKIFYGALLEKQPKTTQEEAYQIIEDLIDEDEYSYEDIYTMLVEEIIKKVGVKDTTKKHKALQIVKM